MMNTRRREFLTMTVSAGAAGAAALTLPSFFSFGNNVALAQDNGTGPDPLMQEIMRQFQRMNAGLAASPPRGNAQQAAGMYRMLAAWAKANKFDAQLKQAVTDAVALDGHNNLVGKLAAFDWAADLKARGITTAPNFRNPTFDHFAKAIAYVKAGFSMENEWKRKAWWLEKNAARINRQMQVLNQTDPNAATIRLIQDDGDIDGDGVPDSIDGHDDRDTFHVEGDCTANADGSWNCNLVATPVSSAEATWCDDAEIFAILSAVALGMFCLVYIWICYFGAVTESVFALNLYFGGCL